MAGPRRPAPAPVSRAAAPGLRSQSVPRAPLPATAVTVTATAAATATATPRRSPRRRALPPADVPPPPIALPAVPPPPPLVLTLSPSVADRAKPSRTQRTRPPAGAPAASPEDAPPDPLAASTHSLPGIGPSLAERLAERGLRTVEDLLWMVPRRYDDVREARCLADVVARVPEGERATLLARVASARMVVARGRRWAEVRLVGVPPSAPASALARWFNVFAGIDRRMPPGATVALSGVIRRRGGRIELANPDILGIEIEGTSGASGASGAVTPSVIARYPDVPGVPASRLRAACLAACARVGAYADDGVPASVERAAGLPGLVATLTQLHGPPPDISSDELAAMNRGDSRWQRRLAFGELFALGVAITLRNSRHQVRVHRRPFAGRFSRGRKIHAPPHSQCRGGSCSRCAHQPG